jgi:hypothetical protein
MWTDVEGRASVSQMSSMTAMLVTATGQSHVHAFVEEDQTNAYTEALAESYFHVEFDLAHAALVSIAGNAGWTRSTVDPPRVVRVSITLYAEAPLASHVRDYTWPDGVTQDDGEVFAFEDALAAGSYALEIIAYTEAFSQGPWRQYAEATATFDVDMEIAPPGDLDGDCSVGLADLAQLLGGYGTPSGAEYQDGDLDGDGDVDLSDLAALLAMYGTSCD